MVKSLTILFEVDYHLRVLQPLHTNWMISLYSHMSSPEGKKIILSGRKITGIFDAIHVGPTGLLPLDRYADLCPYMEATGPTEALSLNLLSFRKLPRQ